MKRGNFVKESKVISSSSGLKNSAMVEGFHFKTDHESEETWNFIVKPKNYEAGGFWSMNFSGPINQTEL